MRLRLPNHLLPPTPDAYLVGGAVRDLILGRRPIDYDLAVAGDPAVFAGRLARHLNGRLVELGKDRFTLYRVVSPAGCVDVSSLKEGCLTTDLLSRDFTINALACRLDNNQVIDPLRGLDDLERHTIRMVSADNLQSDPIRLLRAHRMAVELRFHIDRATRLAIGQYAPLIRNSAGERIWTEWQVILSSPAGTRQIFGMAANGLLETLVPELSSLRRCAQNKHHAYSAFAHTLAAYRALETLLAEHRHMLPPGVATLIAAMDRPTRITLKLAVLLHDIGKPATRSQEHGETTHFYGHAARGATIADGLLRRLRAPSRIRTGVCSIIQHHQRPLSLFLNQSARAEGRFYRICAEQTPYILLHAIADTMGKTPAPATQSAPLLDYFKHLLTHYVDTIQPALQGPPLLTGKDLTDLFGLPPSPRFATLLKAAADARLAGLFSNRPAALQWMQHHLQQAPTDDSS